MQLEQRKHDILVAWRNLIIHFPPEVRWRIFELMPFSIFDENWRQAKIQELMNLNPKSNANLALRMNNFVQRCFGPAFDSKTCLELLKQWHRIEKEVFERDFLDLLRILNLEVKVKIWLLGCQPNSLDGYCTLAFLADTFADDLKNPQAEAEIKECLNWLSELPPKAHRFFELIAYKRISIDDIFPEGEPNEALDSEIMTRQKLLDLLFGLGDALTSQKLSPEVSDFFQLFIDSNQSQLMIDRMVLLGQIRRLTKAEGDQSTFPPLPNSPGVIIPDDNGDFIVGESFTKK
jgi:hypothetical protein